MESEDILGVISSLDGTKYAEVLNAVVPQYNETGSIDVFEKALNKYENNISDENRYITVDEIIRTEEVKSL